MSQYLVLSHIDVQNASSIAGFTWGFPAITGFLGFTHALSRKISQHFGGKYDTTLSGCMVICNGYKHHIYSNNGGFDFRFSQRKFSYTFKPSKKNGKQVEPSIVEEGKMNLTVSLVIELDKPLLLTDERLKQFERTVLDYCYQLRLAGGIILNIKHATLLSANTSEQKVMTLKKIKRFTMPGFVLLDRSAYLQKHYQDLSDKDYDSEDSKPTLLDAWLDFCALKTKANPKLKQGQTKPDLETEADWQYLPKPQSGYLVPLMTGYKAISQVYDAGEVANTRDKITPSCFVESVHSIGEWKGVHSIESIDSVIWRYEHDGQWYLCKQGSLPISDEYKEHELTETDNELLTNLNFNDVLNNW